MHGRDICFFSNSFVISGGGGGGCSHKSHPFKPFRRMECEFARLMNVIFLGIEVPNLAQAITDVELRKVLKSRLVMSNCYIYHVILLICF